MKYLLDTNICIHFFRGRFNLIDKDGYLYIGRQSANNLREIYFACKDFRKPLKVAFSLQEKYKDSEEIVYDIYKDKYWKSFDRFNPDK